MHRCEQTTTSHWPPRATGHAAPGQNTIRVCVRVKLDHTNPWEGEEHRLHSLRFKVRTHMAHQKRTRLDGNGMEGAPESDDIEELVYRRGSDIFFWTDVTQLSIIRLLTVLHEATEEALAKQKKQAYRGLQFNPVVYMYIQSYGGDVFAGLSAMTHIKNNRVEVVTVADGMVASAATLLLLGGTVRYILPYSHILIHQLSGGFYGKHQDMLDESKNSSNIMQSLSQIYLTETTNGERRIKRLMAKELDLTTEQCIKFGIVQGLFPVPNRDGQMTVTDPA